MILKKEPDFKLLSRTETYAKITVSTEKNLRYFDGHFPLVKILPGVAQLHIAIEKGKELFAFKNDQIKSVDQVKFKSPVLAEDEIILELHYDKEKKQMRYHYFKGEIEVSSGKVSLK